MIYKGEALREISFPVGGIGTGSIGLAGNGRLMDWEIFNRPAKGSINGFSHFAIKATGADGTTSAKVLNGDIEKDLVGQYSKQVFGGYGYGPSNMTMAGFPHFRECEFCGEFPIANISFSDADFPAKVNLKAFNPLIPLDSYNSGLPVAFFEIEVENTATERNEYSIAFSVMNPFGKTENFTTPHEKFSMASMKHAEADMDDIAYGDMTVATDCENALIQNYWYRGGWNDGIVTFWNEFSASGDLRERTYDTSGEKDMTTVVGKVSLAANEKKSVRFVLAWNVPNNYNYWKPLKDAEGKDVSWKNYYATQFATSADSAEYALTHWDTLYKKTLAFHDSLFDSTLDAAVIDAAASTLSVLKSPTVLRLEDGAFYGWEGVHEEEGSCEGTCQHVWNYAYAMCFLFPDLERSIREQEFTYSTNGDGEMQFRMALPRGREAEHFRACLDGQMGAVIKTYREWKLSGDDAWLKSRWESVKKVLEFAWSDKNPDEWDRNKDGVLEGRQHHTLDMELFGASSWLEGFYLAALKAASLMADHLGETDKAEEYRTLFEKGYAWTKEHLFNGKYFIQDVDLNDKSRLEHFDALHYWNEEAGEMKYQIAGGSEIDQLLAQWHANLLGLGNIFDPEQVKAALPNLYRNNFKTSMRSFTNPWRIFALNDESGAIICDYPEGTYKPVIPIPYCEESMHGFEYSLAGLLISEGMIDEGLSIVRAVRNRYDGKKRNPWNEIECGSNYARSMASFALIPILSGFSFDMPHHTIGFAPKTAGAFKSFWGVATAWGNVVVKENTFALEILQGSLTLEKLRLPFIQTVKELKVDGKPVNFDWKDGSLSFAPVTATATIEVL